MQNYFTIRVLAVSVFFWALQQAHAAAIDDIKLQVSSDICDGSNPADKSLVVYATNTNQNRRISANFSYDSAPSGQSFSLRDSNLISFTEQFPKYHERRLAPGERAKVGCTVNYRSSSNPMSNAAVPIVIATAGAVYVNPSEPEPPPEKAADFVAFFNQVRINDCKTGGPRLPGLLVVVNLHPYRTLSVTVELAPVPGKHPDHFNATLAPLTASSIACSNGIGSPIRVTKARLTGNL
jgi:hypothetical protein